VAYIDKLIRDKVAGTPFWDEYEDLEWGPDILEPYPDDVSFEAALDAKAFEELWEVLDATTDEGVISELGDLLTVIKAKAELHGCWLDVVVAERIKTAERGGFGDRMRCAGTLPEGYR
jgi:predicted house-cleaning noncanonical NTP pyrophosphatase (MazG superfamily)